MNLDEALHILARVHTRDDHEVGFCIEVGARPEPYFGFSQAEYYEAWKAVRMHLHLNINPPPQPNTDFLEPGPMSVGFAQRLRDPWA
jgi:hypothetical protein